MLIQNVFLHSSRLHCSTCMRQWGPHNRISNSLAHVNAVTVCTRATECDDCLHQNSGGSDNDKVMQCGNQVPRSYLTLSS